MLCKLPQPVTKVVFTFVVELGIVRLVKPKQFWNTYEPIVVIVLGITMLDNAVHP